MLLVSAAARAEPEPGPAVAPKPPASATAATPGVTLPVARNLPELVYPDGAHGDELVVLELVVDVDGRVKEVHAQNGRAPFAASAEAAAALWTFAPARRAGQPVVARIRFEVRFIEPPAEPATPPAPGAAPPATKTPKRAAPIQVLVEEERPNTVRRSFTRAEVRELPGAFGDPFRAIEAMPGVTPMISGVPFFYVRGAPPGNVGYFLDGIRVPLLYHFGFGPGVIHPAIVDRVDLYPGGYPARYGRYAGAIVAGETARAPGKFRGEANVRLVDAGAMLEAPFARGQGDAQLSGRYSYTAALITLFAPEAILNYWDYQARIGYQVTPKDRLTLFSFGAYDYLGEQEDGRRTKTLASTEFHRLDLRWDRAISAASSLRVAVTLGLDRTRAGGDGDDEFRVTERSFGVRTEYERRFDDDARLRVGADALLGTFELKAADSPESEVEFGLGGRDDFTAGLYGEFEFRPAPRVRVTPGLRFDLYRSGDVEAFAIEPRLSATFEITPKLRLIHTLGLASQPPGFIVPIPGFRVAGLRGGLQRSWQESAGLEVDLPARFTASATLFQNIFFNLADPLTTIKTFDSSDDGEVDEAVPDPSALPDAPPEQSSDSRRLALLEARALGRAVGLELLIRRRLSEKVGGFLAYTLSRSDRRFDDVDAASGWDRTHVLSAALSFDLGGRFRAGTRFTFYSGIPATVDDPALQRLSPRTTPFYRIDARLEKRWALGSNGAWLALVLEMLNATLTKEAVDRNCSTPSSCSEEKVGPIALPSIGLEAMF